MPRTSTIFSNRDDFEKLERKVKAEGYPSKYAFIKDLILKAIKD